MNYSGRFSNADYVRRFEARTILDPDGCITWLGTFNDRGYGHCQLFGKSTLAHRVAVILDGREIPVGAHVDHLCRNKKCVNPAHLEVVSCAVNTQRGDAAKLTPEEVADIKRRYDEAGDLPGFVKGLASKHGVSPRTIQKIGTGERWGNIKAAA